METSSHSGHSHSHSIEINRSTQSTFLIGIGLNIAFVLAEVIAGLVYNSIALLTDAGHNLSDVGTLLISLVAFWMAKRKSSAVYTYGYKKTTVLAALANAVILLIAIGILGYESFHRLFHPEPVSGGVIAWVAAVGVAINGFSAFLFSRQKSELNSRAAYLHLLSDALISMGVIAGGIAIAFTGYYWLDPAIGIVVMIVILISTWGLLRDSFKMTIDAVPAGVELEKIKQIILGVPHVKDVFHVHVWSLSTTENAMTAHVVVDESLSFEQKLATVKEIKHALEHHNIHHITIELSDSKNR
jgi:cobalt-zinc-cadmium efflux system protein